MNKGRTLKQWTWVLMLKRNENGRTITGLYAYFYRHMKMQKIDKYGVCHTVVEKEKFYKCTRRTKTLWSITVFGK
jgi:hypothetical protein